MKSVVRMAHTLGAFGALMLLGLGCNDSSSTPQPAPNFTLTDSNPTSSTYGESRALSDASGRVIVIHFALYT